MRLFLLIILLCISTFSHSSQTNLEAEQSYFFVLTQPKGGTGLINKLIRMITNKTTCEAPNKSFKTQQHLADLSHITCFLNDKQYPFRHFVPFNKLYDEIHQLYPEIVPIIHIRDLRDVCVAVTFSRESQFDKTFGIDTPFADRLLYVIQHSEELGFHDIKANAEYAVEWLNKPGVVVSRFEELIGEKGGGSSTAQLETINRIANAIHVKITKQIWEKIGEELFGDSKTFRKGIIGEWKEYFTEEHKTAFKKSMGTLLIQMGYESDNNW